MRNVRTILKNLKIQHPDGKTEVLGSYLKTLPVEQMRSDVIKILSLTSDRMKVTDDRRVLTDFYALFLSLNVGKDEVVNIEK